MLDSFVLPRYRNLIKQTIGVDSPEGCINPDVWHDYPYPVEYKFNERGYRDLPWPQDLSNVVWCFGDSFTMGLGSPLEHTWPAILAKQIKYPVITIALNGASNAWIARKICELLSEVTPRAVIAQWSYTHRREAEETSIDIDSIYDRSWNELYNTIKDPLWPPCKSLKQFVHLPKSIRDEILHQHDFPLKDHWFTKDGDLKLFDCPDDERLQHYTYRSTPQQDSQHTIENILKAEQCCESNQIPFVYGFIPKFTDSDGQRTFIFDSIHGNNWGETPQLDRARDWFHYDRITSEYVVQQILQRLGDAIA